MKAGLSKLLESLSAAEQAEVETFASYLLARRIGDKLRNEEEIPATQPLHSILELKGLGKDIWQGIDAQEYVERERGSWRG